MQTRSSSVATRRRSFVPIDNSLARLARAVGIVTSYSDMAGEMHYARAETIKALLKHWGLQVDSQRSLKESLHKLKLERLREVVPPVSVVWSGKSGKVPLRLTYGSGNARVKLRLTLEDGTSGRVALGAENVVNVAGQRFTTTKVVVPQLPLGYHSLDLEVAGVEHRCLLIAAPEICYSPPEPFREVGLFVPMYALHSRRSWGAGNLEDWSKFSRWAADCGCKVLATLPLLSNFLEKPLCEPSPYSPATRLFWSEFYTAIEQVPEFVLSRAVRKWFHSSEVQTTLNRFRSEPLIHYRPQMAIRRKALEMMASHFFRNVSSRHGHFQAFLKERPELSKYAEFRATCDKTGISWRRWNSCAREGNIKPQDFDESCKQYYLYSQWVFEQQMGSFLSDARLRGQYFYLDLPLGVHPDGYDVWRYREFFALPASAGAPPDPFFTKGQNWGFAPLHPKSLRDQRYHYWLELLRFQMRHSELLRLDHVMGLHRLYWVPQGFPASHGAYVSYPAEELHAILCLESHRHKTVLIGESLGTVPPEVTRSMAQHRLREIYALQYEQRPDPRQPVRVPPRRSVAGINTHDMPTFTAHLLGKDISLRTKLGLLRRTQRVTELRTRKKLNTALVAFLTAQGFLETETNDPIEILAATLEFLGRSPAEILLVTLEDLWRELHPQNTPTTSSQLPNWRRKIRFSLEELKKASRQRRLLVDLVNCRRQSSQRPWIKVRQGSG